MAELYLCTPRQFDPQGFAGDLARVMDDHAVACVRVAVDSTVEGDVRAAAVAVQAVCAERDVPVVIADHYRLVGSLGLSGAHLTGTQHLRAARDAMPKGAILGAYCGTSRHVGLTAGEIGADYASFGPVSDTGLGSGETAPFDLFEWWAQMIEIPIVAEGHVTRDAAAALKDHADFLCIGDEIWGDADPSAALTRLLG